jgi:hypothetical protein
MVAFVGNACVCVCVAWGGMEGGASQGGESRAGRGPCWKYGIVDTRIERGRNCRENGKSEA